MVIPADADQDEAELAGYFDNVSSRAHAYSNYESLAECAHYLPRVDLASTPQPDFLAPHSIVKS